VSRFFDGDQQPGSEMCVVLWRAYEHGAEQWKMVRRIGYVDAHYDEPFRVPNDMEGFRTDLTSVPQVFGWLITRSGTHLPAALLHDGLVIDPGEAPSYLGPPITRVEADRIFRDAMADLGTPLVRRWLVWTAVTLATVRTLRPRLLGWLLFAGLAAILALGVLSTLDLFDVIDWVPWMGDGPWWREALSGAAAAVLAPVVVMIPWHLRRLYIGGLIAGWALALLLHVTAAVAAITLLYRAIERIFDRFDRFDPSVDAG
jgi:hypothetical protein